MIRKWMWDLFNAHFIRKREPTMDVTLTAPRDVVKMIRGTDKCGREGLSGRIIGILASAFMPELIRGRVKKKAFDPKMSQALLRMRQRSLWEETEKTERLLRELESCSLEMTETGGQDAVRKNKGNEFPKPRRYRGKV